MDAIKGNPSETLFFVALNTGMRLSEILGLRWSRVDFKKGLIKIDAQLLVKRGKDMVRELGLPKNSKPRSFKPAPTVMDLLRSVERQQKEWRLVSFTLDVYGHVTKAMQDEAANKLQAVILGRKQGAVNANCGKNCGNGLFQTYKKPQNAVFQGFFESAGNRTEYTVSRVHQNRPN